MTSSSSLLTVDCSSAIHFFELGSEAIAEQILGWTESGLTVRTLRGRKMRKLSGMFDEFSAALQFPYYFGENWPAFDECLSEMDWLSARIGIAIVIFDCVEVLADAEHVELEILVRTVRDSARAYSQPIGLGEWWDRPALPFHLVLHASSPDAPAARARWQAAGAGLSEFRA